MKRVILTLSLLVAFASLQSLASAADDFPRVAAELHKVRGGLGNVLKRLQDGKDVRIAYFGGSITAANGWRPKTLKWFQKQYPQANVEQIHAAIGGTGSDLGVFRCGQDVLKQKPHLVFVEFAVNDGGAPPERIYRTMEGIVRQIWQADPLTDICFVYTVHRGQMDDYRQGNCSRSASAMEHLADHYGIPSICMPLRIAQLEKEGKLVFKDDPANPAPESQGKIIFCKDDCHPLDAGHEVYKDVIGAAIKTFEPVSKPGPHELKEPFRADNWENAKLVAITPDMLSGSWKKLDPNEGLGRAFGNRLPSIWNGSTPGDKLSFKFKGTQVALYDLLGPDGGKVQITIDGKTLSPRNRFDHYCTYHRLASLQIAQGLEDKEHEVTVEILPEQPDRSSVVDKVRDKPGFDPAKYDGTNMWVGYIMMIGDPVPAK